jgi:hypothetical protein
MINPLRTDEYYQGLKSAREGTITATKKLKEVKDPLNLSHYQVRFLPSYLKAANDAINGKIYCFWCGSDKVIKGGRKEKRAPDLSSFQCKECTSNVSYRMDKKTYDSFQGFKPMKKGKKPNFINPFK